MHALLITAFFNIGRGDWKGFGRSTEHYLMSFRRYVAQLPVDKYILCPEAMRKPVGDAVDHFDAAELSELSAYRFIEPTRTIMESEAFKGLFRDAGQPEPTNPECCIPEYNIAMLAKWDALERALALTAGRFTHYIWADFGLGHRVKKRPYLPPPGRVSPIARDRIVVSADRGHGLPALDAETLTKHVRSLRDQVAGAMFVVPAELVAEFSGLVRSGYQQLLDAGLTSDDQVVLDMCVRRRPDLFHLSYPPVGLDKFNHVHNILNGLDATEPEDWTQSSWAPLAYRLSRPFARARIGLPMQLSSLVRR